MDRVNGVGARTLLEERVALYSSDKVMLSGMHQRIDGKPKASIVLCHGICSSKDYAGFQAGLADELGRCGFETLRFDFRGHGESSGRPEDTTIAGEISDLAAAIHYLKARNASRIGVIGHSLGGAIAVLYAAQSHQLPFALVLLSPALDFRRTFLEPESPWAKQWFTPDAIKKAIEGGAIRVGGLTFGRELVREFQTLDPVKTLRNLSIPILIIHGNGDTIVSVNTVVDTVGAFTGIELIRIAGAKHYFEGVEKDVFNRVSSWLQTKASTQRPPYSSAARDEQGTYDACCGCHGYQIDADD